MLILPNENSAEQPLPVSENRQGFALAGALLALVVVGALLTGSFYAANQEQSIGVSSRFSDEALYVTEAALDSADAGMSKQTLKLMAVGATQRVLNGQVINDGAGNQIGTASVWVTRMGQAPDRYLFIGQGRTSRGGSAGGGTRVLGLMTQLIDVSFPMGTAMQLWSGIDVKGNSVVNGNDMYPTGSNYGQWSGCTTTGPHAGIVTRDTTQVDVTGSAQVVGASPPIVQNTSLDSASFLKYGSTNYDQLAAAAEASKIIPAGATRSQIQPSLSASGSCQTSDTNNWGEPGSTDSHATIMHACDNYFPIIHALGDLHVSGVRGQGILLVDGNLDISGGFDFWGVTVVRGTVSTSGTGGHFYGTVLAFNKGVLDYTNVSTGNSLVNYSTCAIQRASSNVEGYNYAVPVKAHSWIDLTAANAGY